ncbi:hypothetical protein AKJ37_05555 [candidate division MSBL1 archaeon SCGC-AAA259I09]|uniref:DUF5667 domain-containing protein n=1 Tax=candidate division MSBL1 archaeon SCGC-AAA259I09 TaxID=1698267 RepID=A0A133UPY7_9EURY|nr:hypothetical protein AKJ37_05555 [candidate division MSBL1 archaeon SCGC-AAA259I09]
MGFDQKGIETATVFIVLGALVFGTIGPSILADAVDAQPDGPLYSLELIGESIKKPFLNDRAWYISHAEERLNEFLYVDDRGKADKYSWLAEKPNSYFSKAITLSKNTEELDSALTGFRKYSLKLENIKTEVSSEVGAELKGLQLQSFLKVGGVKNMVKEKKFSEIKVAELEDRLRAIEIETDKLVDKKGSELEFELIGDSEKVSLRMDDTSLALQLGEIQENPRIEQIENLVLEIEKVFSENHYVEIGPAENTCIVWPEDKIRLESGLENVKLKVHRENIYIGRPENLREGIKNLKNIGIGLPENLENTIQPENIELTVTPENIENLEKIPLRSIEYVLKDFSMKTLTLDNRVYNVGIQGKVYAPKEMHLNENCPVYLYFNREKSNLSTKFLSNFGITVCVGPGINFSIYNPEYWDLYLHFGIGVATPFGNKWDWQAFHWPIMIQRPEKTKIQVDVPNRLKRFNIGKIKPGEWKGPYKVTVKAKKVRVGKSAKQVIEKKILQKQGFGHFYRLTDDFGIYVERQGDGEYSVGLYQRNLDTVKICAGPGIVFSIPVEIWLHGGLGTGNWDEHMKHFHPIDLSFEGATAKPSESKWDRVDWYSMRASKSNPSIERKASHINGHLRGTTTCDEEKLPIETLAGDESVYFVKVKEKFTPKAGREARVDGIRVYYQGSENFSAGDKVTGYLKMVKRGPETKYLCALDEGYTITRPVEGRLYLRACSDEYRVVEILPENVGQRKFPPNLYAVDVTGSVDGASWLGWIPVYYQGSKGIEKGDNLTGYGSLYSYEGYIDAFSDNYWIKREGRTKPEITSVVVKPSEAWLNVGDFENFYAIATYSDGENKYVTDDVEWTVDPPTIGDIGIFHWLSVEPPFCAARFHAENSGEGTVTVSYKGHSNTAEITVENIHIKQLENKVTIKKG